MSTSVVLNEPRQAVVNAQGSVVTVLVCDADTATTLAKVGPYRGHTWRDVTGADPMPAPGWSWNDVDATWVRPAPQEEPDDTAKEDI